MIRSPVDASYASHPAALTLLSSLLATPVFASVSSTANRPPADAHSDPDTDDNASLVSCAPVPVPAPDITGTCTGTYSLSSLFGVPALLSLLPRSCLNFPSQQRGPVFPRDTPTHPSPQTPPSTPKGWPQSFPPMPLLQKFNHNSPHTVMTPSPFPSFSCCQCGFLTSHFFILFYFFPLPKASIS